MEVFLYVQDKILKYFLYCVEINVILYDTLNGRVKFLYVAPERLANQQFVAFAQKERNKFCLLPSKKAQTPLYFSEIL